MNGELLRDESVQIAEHQPLIAQNGLKVGEKRDKSRQTLTPNSNCFESLVVKFFESVKAVSAVPHVFAGLRYAADLLGQFQNPSFGLMIFS